MGMNLYQILSLLGVGSIVGAVWKMFFNRIKRVSDDNVALKLGVQALLRAQMISDYNHWSEKGFAPIWARENFENVWKQYESLGQNGVMNDIHKKFLALPTTQPREKKIS